MSTSSSLRQQFGAFCTNVPLGVRTLLEAPGLTTTLTAPKTALCVCVSTPGQKVFVHWFNGRGCLEKSAEAGDLCVSTPGQRVFHHHLSQAGGRSAIASLLPTKTLAIGSETRPDQSGVPAFNTMTPLVHPAAVSLVPWFFS